MFKVTWTLVWVVKVLIVNMVVHTDKVVANFWTSGSLDKKTSLWRHAQRENALDQRFVRFSPCYKLCLLRKSPTRGSHDPIYENFCIFYLDHSCLVSSKQRTASTSKVTRKPRIFIRIPIFYVHHSVPPSAALLFLLPYETFFRFRCTSVL